MSSLSGLLNDRTALFLDFDGTLAELAPRPDAVVVPNDLAPMLERLHQRLGGALAIITGRTQSDIDTMLRPLALPGAFEHGAVRRTRHGLLAVDCHPDLAPVVTTAQALAARHPGLLVERKRTAMALHYRLAPDLEALCVRTVRDAVGHTPGLQLLQGKAVIEVKSAHASKGKAITAFMAEAPFHGRVPLFLGDDVTDEAGFEAVHRLGGAGIKIGPGATQAQHHMADPAAVRAWLRSSVQDLSCTP